jgi:hypothetical protein
VDGLLAVLDIELIEVVEHLDEPIEVLFLVQVQDDVVARLFLHLLSVLCKFNR